MSRISITEAHFKVHGTLRIERHVGGRVESGIHAVYAKCYPLHPAPSHRHALPRPIDGCRWCHPRVCCYWALLRCNLVIQARWSALTEDNYKKSHRRLRICPSACPAQVADPMGVSWEDRHHSKFYIEQIRSCRKCETTKTDGWSWNQSFRVHSDLTSIKSGSGFVSRSLSPTQVLWRILQDGPSTSRVLSSH